MNNIKDILEERNNTHGSFTVNAIISQELKRVIKVYIVYTLGSYGSDAGSS